MLELESCCFCVPLRKGCLILGYLHLVASIALTIVSGLDLSTIIRVKALQVFDKDAVNVAIATIVISLLLALVLLIFAMLLVVGLHKEKKNYVKAYLIYYVFFIILSTIVYIVHIATSPIALAYILGHLVKILLSVYFMLVIRSHWLTMCENSGNNFNTAYSARRSEN